MHLAGEIPQGLGISILLHQLGGFPSMHLFTSLEALRRGFPHMCSVIFSVLLSLLSFFSTFNLFLLNEGLA